MTSPYTVNGNVTLTTVLTEKDKSVKVDLVFNQDAIVTIDGKEYLPIRRSACSPAPMTSRLCMRAAFLPMLRPSRATRMSV